MKFNLSLLDLEFVTKVHAWPYSFFTFLVAILLNWIPGLASWSACLLDFQFS